MTAVLNVKLSERQVRRLRIEAKKYGASVGRYVSELGWQTIANAEAERANKFERALRKIARDGGTSKLLAWDIPAYAKKTLEESR